MGSVAGAGARVAELVLQTHKRLGMGVGAKTPRPYFVGCPRWCCVTKRKTKARAPWRSGWPSSLQWRRCCTRRCLARPDTRPGPGSCQGAACLFSAVFEPQVTQAQIDAFCDRLQRFRLGYSWAGPVSLCAPYNMGAIRPEGWAHAGGLVRFSVGLEDTADLQADLAQALAAL